MNIDDYEKLANSSCSWICPNCDLPNFSTTLLDSPTGSIVLCNSFDILSTNCTQTTSSTPRGNMNCTNVPKRDKTSKRNKLRGMIINCNGLNYMMRILFWELNQSFILVYLPIPSSRLRARSLERTEMVMVAEFSKQ